jgi:regulator of sirC expression with transglutaminase-like and TPR domain
MNSTDAIESPGTLAEKQRKALISLLADEDPAIYQIVRTKLLSYGHAAATWLRPHTLSSDALMRRRATEIVTYLARQTSDQKFLAFCLRQSEDLDLEEATGLLAQTQYPDTNIEAYRALYDNWADELRGRVTAGGEVDQTLSTINRYLFHELGFSGNEQYGYEPDACYLNRVVDNRSGNPIGLCAVYLFVARRLRLPVVGIGLPGHFVCRYQSSTKEIYIDVFRRGKFLTKGDCVRYLLQTNYGLQQGHLSPVSSRRVLLRMCSTLHQTYGHLEMAEEAARVHRYVVALTK